MWSESESNSTGVGKDPMFILGVIFVALVLVTICALSILSLRLPRSVRPVPTVEIITESIPAVMPVSYHSIGLPVIMSGSVSIPASVTTTVSESIWRVTRIKKLGYEMEGRRYDLAMFNRLGSQETVKAYCLNRGWDSPGVGTEYTLNTEGVFTPVSEDEANPFQRFQMIQ